MLILANGGHLGLLSGGCLEADLKEHADEVLRCGIPRAVEYDMRGPDDILFGIAAGVGISYAVRAAFLAGFPTLSIQITAGWILRAGAIALIGAIFGASYPAWIASRKDAVEALSYD